MIMKTRLSEKQPKRQIHEFFSNCSSLTHARISGATYLNRSGSVKFEYGPIPRTGTASPVHNQRPDWAISKFSRPYSGCVRWLIYFDFFREMHALHVRVHCFTPNARKLYVIQPDLFIAPTRCADLLAGHVGPRPKISIHHRN